MRCRWIVKAAVVALAATVLVLMVAVFVGGGGAQETTVRVHPARVELGQVGDRFSAQVVVEGVTNLAAFQFSLEFDPGVLEAAAPEQGPFLGSGAREVACRDGEVGEGSASLTCVTLGPPVSAGGPPGPDGEGVLATVEFTAKGKGETALGFQDVKLLQAEIDEAGAPIIIPIAAEDGEVTVAASEGFHWVLWGPAIGVVAVVVVAAGLTVWRRLARGR